MFSRYEDVQGETATDKDKFSQKTEEYTDANGMNLDYHDVAAANGIKDPNKIKKGRCWKRFVSI